MFKRKAVELETALRKAGFTGDVSVNSDKPRKGFFEVKANGAVIVSLPSMPRPFTKLREADIAGIASKVAAAVGSDPAAVGGAGDGESAAKSASEPAPLTGGKRKKADAAPAAAAAAADEEEKPAAATKSTAKAKGKAAAAKDEVGENAGSTEAAPAPKRGRKAAAK